MDFWQWGVGALLLLIAEMLLPGFYLLWLGVAAVVVALLTFLWSGMPLELQILVFAIVSVASIFGWRFWRNKHPEVSDQPNLNERANHYIGKTYTLDEAIVNGVGKVRLGDTVWKVEGPESPEGATVKVIGVDGMTLKVEAL